MHLKKKWINRRVYEYFMVTIAPWFNRDVPVLIYQMGKVGSSSLRNSLFRCQNPRTRRILMSHEYFPIRMRDPDRIEIEPEYQEMLEREIRHEQRIYEQFSLLNRMGRRFREKFYAERIYKAYVRPQRPLRVITLVREPVANNISMFFQRLRHYISSDAEISDYGTDELISIFLENYMHSRPITWLDAEIKTNFGIDVFRKPFPVHRGHTVISEGKTSLLVLRCELDDRTKARAVADFLGLDEFEIVRSNVTSEKSYATQYAEFRQRIKIPTPLLDQMYNSKFARHFYSSEERKKFRARWAGASTAS